MPPTAVAILVLLTGTFNNDTREIQGEIMRQFLTDNNQAFRDFEQSRDAALFFMIRNATGNTARLVIGFLRSIQDGSAVLLSWLTKAHSEKNQEICMMLFSQGRKKD